MTSRINQAPGQPQVAGASLAPLLQPTSTDSGGVSSGVSGQTGPIGDVSGATGDASHLDIVLSSLMEMMPQTSVANVVASNIETQQNMQATETESSEQTTQSESLQQQNVIKEQQAQIQQAEQKIQQAQQASSSGSIWDKIEQAFSYLAAVVAIAVGAVLCATGVGAGIGALMIAGGVVGLVGAINSTVESATGSGILGHVALAFGASASQASTADEAFGIGLAVVGIALAVGTMGAGVANMVGAGGEAVSSLFETGEEVSQGAQLAAKTAQTVGNVVNAAGQIGGAVSGAVAAGYTYQAAQDKAGAETAQGSQALDQAVINQITAAIKAMIQNMNAIFTSGNDQVASSMQTLSSIVTTGNNVKFA